MKAAGDLNARSKEGCPLNAMTVGPQAKMIATAAMTMYEDKLHTWSSLCICKRMKSATTDTTIPALGLTS